MKTHKNHKIPFVWRHTLWSSTQKTAESHGHWDWNKSPGWYVTTRSEQIPRLWAVAHPGLLLLVLVFLLLIFLSCLARFFFVRSGMTFLEKRDGGHSINLYAWWGYAHIKMWDQRYSCLSLASTWQLGDKTQEIWGFFMDVLLWLFSGCQDGVRGELIFNLY